MYFAVGPGNSRLNERIFRLRGFFSVMIAGMALFHTTCLASADGWFRHRFGEMRAYHGDWLAVCANKTAGPCRAVQSAADPGSGAAFDRRLTLHRVPDSPDWAVEVMDRGMPAKSLETVVFTFDGDRVEIDPTDWRAGGLDAINVADTFVMTKPELTSDLIKRMRKGNRLVVSYAPAGEGNGQAAFSLRGVTAATRAIDERVAAMSQSSSEVDLETDKPSIQAADAQKIVSTIWLWNGFKDESDENNIVVPNPESYRLHLRADGTFTFQADCNAGNGSYELDGNSLTFNPLMATTLAECGKGSLYNTYLRLLHDVRTFVRSDDQLYLNLMADGGNMEFGKFHAVTGVITAPDGAAMPEHATVEVKINDVSLADAPATQVGGQIIYGAKQFPVRFEATYHAPGIMPQHTYGAQVRILDSQGRTVFINTSAVNVLTWGNATYDIEVPVEMVN